MFPHEIIPHSNTWLKEQIKNRSFTQKVFANLLDVSPAQLNRNLNGTENIPDAMLEMSCRILGISDKETRIIMNRHYVHNKMRDLDIQTDQLSSRKADGNIGGLLNKVQDLLCDVAISLYRQSYLLDEEIKLKRLQNFLNDANYLIKILVRTHLGEKGVLINAGNTNFHLRQPLSSYVGSILRAASKNNSDQLSILKEKILQEFRALAEDKYETGNGLDYAQQHAVHMLGRYGETSDQEFVERYTTIDDILAKRMALFGLSLGGNSAIDEELFSLVQRDPYFLQAVASFDAVHYGDASFDGRKLPTQVEGLDVTISNSLAYITQDVETENLDLNFIKLTAFCQEFGSGVFDEKHWVVIEEILRKLRNSDGVSNPRKKFLEVFEKIRSTK